jgi:LysM repeat protein
MRIVVRLVVLTVVLALSVVAVAPAAAAPLPAPPPQSATGTILGVHTVQQGETFDCIGRAYSVDPNAIAQANGTGSPVAGQKLNIPAVPWYNIPAGTPCPAQFQVPAGWPPANTSPAQPQVPADGSAPYTSPEQYQMQPGGSPLGTILGRHTVKQGEWIYCIARAYKVDPLAIARASGIPGPYGPSYSCGYGCGYGGKSGPYGGCGSYGWCGGCGSYGWCGGYYPYYSPWNYVWPGQVLQIPAVPWYNIPAGPTCAPQFRLPAGWPPPPPTYAPYPAPY